MSIYEDDFGDGLVERHTPDLAPRFFDRFMFNGHSASGRGISFIVGAGVYPPRDIADGFAVVSVGDEQRNARFSTHLSETPDHRVGPLSWSVTSAMNAWTVRFDDPSIAIGLDFEWISRAPAWHGTVEVANTDAAPTRFDHLFQSGLLTGTLTVDGEAVSLDGWYSQRDRSRGVRTMSGGQGLHVWMQAQFPDISIGLLLVESRAGDALQIEGAAMHTDGQVDPIVAARHDLAFDDLLDLRGGTVSVRTLSGAVHTLTADASDRGGYMAGGGYGGHHGKDYGVDHHEHDRYPLDGSVGPASFDTPLTDRLARFTLDGVEGSGIFEFAHSRSSSYRYHSNLTDDSRA